MAEKTSSIWFWLLAFILIVRCLSCDSQVIERENRNKVAQRAEDIRPVLIGQPLPKMVLRTMDDKTFDLNAATAEKPTVLIFFRGGWCPYCNLHLNKLQSIESKLVELSFQIMAVSPDRPEKLTEPSEKNKLKYRLLSDSEMTGAKALGIAFRVDDGVCCFGRNDCYSGDVVFDILNCCTKMRVGMTALVAGLC